MQKLSKFVLFLFLVVSLLATYYMLHATTISAQVPEILLSCSETRPNEFHSLRPYQAAPCGGAPQALFCSNKLVIFEDFELAHRCQKYRKYQTGTVQCDPNYHVDAHNLNITLDESEFPIMGNTQDEFDDAQKLNEYASWYLNGVIDKRENENPTDSQIVDFSGPVRKLVPSMIQDAQRIKTLESATNISTDTTQPTNPLEEDDTAQGEPENHDQLVIGDKRLTSWSIGTISIPRAFSNMAQNFLSKIPGVGDTFSQYITPAWNNRFPPLPWTTIGGKQLTELEYKKYYNEWLGKSCIIIPFLNSLFCFDNPGVTNEYADLWHFVPLSNNSDKRGKNYLLTGDGPNYVPSQGTEIEDAQHKSYLNAPLYFAHTQEVASLSALLNQTYQPSGYKAEKLSKTVETLPKNEFGLNCSAVNVRVNEGDDLFPGDRPSGKELYVEGAEYDITNVECDEVYERVEVKCKDPKIKGPCYDFEDSFVCNAEVGIEFKLGTQTPFANEIFADTVADSGSTFRKIFPKVEEGAPVSCIADIPTVTNVTYSIDNPLNQEPNGGSQTFKQTKYPADGAGDNTELTFPHIGSVYEYFLKGIQTALRPKGYGEPIANGNCGTNVSCGELPNLPKAIGSCNLGGVSSRVGNIPQSLKDIVSAAAETYKVPPNLILGIMFGEGLFGGSNKKDWTDENVKNWSTCTPVPGCQTSGDDHLMGFNGNTWQNVAKKIKPDLQKLDPNRGEPNVCNLLDAVYGIAWDLHDSADGGMPFTCFGIDLNAPIPTSCSWNNNQFESAIKVSGSGYTSSCLTKPGSCLTGGGLAATCPSGDTCEKYTTTGNTSHNACVWDVAHRK